MGRHGRRAPQSLRLVVGGEKDGVQLTDFLVRELRIPEKEARALVGFGSVHVNGRRVLQGKMPLKALSDVRVCLSAGIPADPYQIDPQRILFRDAHLLAYDKEPGIASQETPSDACNHVLAAVRRFLQEDTSLTPYVALHHRLDQRTTGVILLSLDPSVNARLGAAFRERRVAKLYLAWVEGVVGEDAWTVRVPIARKAGGWAVCAGSQGKPAETRFEVLLREADRSLVCAQPLTGRTHQIRLHLASTGHPVIGDRRYGSHSRGRLLLHAYQLRLNHPVTDRELTLRAPIPPDWPPPHRLDVDAPGRIAWPPAHRSSPD